jgi:hypothetical protein
MEEKALDIETIESVGCVLWLREWQSHTWCWVQVLGARKEGGSDADSWRQRWGLGQGAEDAQRSLVKMRGERETAGKGHWQWQVFSVREA